MTNLELTGWFKEAAEWPDKCSSEAGWPNKYSAETGWPDNCVEGWPLGESHSGSELLGIMARGLEAMVWFGLEDFVWLAPCRKAYLFNNSLKTMTMISIIKSIFNFYNKETNYLITYHLNTLYY